MPVAEHPLLDALFVQFLLQRTGRRQIDDLAFELAGLVEALFVADLAAAHVEQERSRRLPHQQA